MTAYEEDLAFIHDAGFVRFAHGAAPGVLEILRRNGVDGGLVVDLGCGSGVWARHLADAGFRVLGIDISAAMIELSRRRVPEGEFRAASFFDVELPRCAAVTSLSECFNYLFDESNDLRRLGELLRRVHDALQPGGPLIFDVAEPGRGAAVARVGHWQGEDWDIVSKAEEDVGGERLTRRIVAFRRVGEHYRRSSEVHEQRLYRRGDVLRELAAAGFTAELLDAYGAMPLPASCAGFLARKR